MKNKSFIKIFSQTLVLLSPLGLSAQEVAATGVQSQSAGVLEWTLQNILPISVAVIVIAALATILRLFFMFLQMQKMELIREHGTEALEKLEIVKKDAWWKSFYKRATKAIPIDQEKDVLFDHEYDGIQELDNVLPPWWVAMFYATIIIGVVYLGYYHVSGYGLSSSEKYALSIERAEEAKKVYLAGQANLVDETNATLLTDENALSAGGIIFTEKCSPCHGLQGEGNSIGPNLTDQYWLHGGDVKDVFRTVKNGVPEKGMISWSSQLTAADIHRVASYIISLQGTNPPNAKEPQGNLYEVASSESSDTTEAVAN